MTVEGVRTYAQSPAKAPATLVVTLPEDATLTIDNTPTTQTSGKRVFVSPPLQVGSKYIYTLQAQVMRDGQPVTLTQEVAVIPGQETQVRLEIPAAAVTAGRD